MADRLQQYAGWITSNADKKGTPQYQAVADAYKMLRNKQTAAPAAVAQQQAAPVVQQQPAPVPVTPQQNDGAFMYGIDKGQELMGKGVEVAGRLIGSETIEKFGTGIVEQQRADIKAGNYQPQFPGSLRENYEQGNFFSALGEKLLENLPQMGFALTTTAATGLAAYFGAPAWAVIGGTGITLTGSGLMGAGESALEAEEKTGSYDEKVAAGVGVIIGILDKFGAGKVIPANKLAKMSADQIIDELRSKGFGEAAQDIAKRTIKAGTAEGVTEMGQDASVIAGAAAQGAEYTPTEVGDRMIDAGILGKTMGGGTRLTTEVLTGGAPDTGTKEAAAQRLTELGDVINPVMIGNDPQAAADFARKLQGIADANNFNLKDVRKNSTKGARQAVDMAHRQYKVDLKRLANDLKSRLDITDNDEIDVVLDKVLAIAAQEEARTKAKDIVGMQEMEAVDRLVGETQEGQEMLSIMRQMNELTTLHNDGYVAGLSKFTDQLSPLPSNVGYSDRSLIETPTRILGSLYGASVNPAIPVVQGAAVIGGRAVDAITGRRSRVAKYIRDNKEKQGTEPTGEFSVREVRNAEAKAIKQASEDDLRDAQEMHKQIYEANGRFGDVSPQQMVLDSVGLSPQNAVSVLQELAKNPAFRRAANGAIKSIKSGGQIPNMPYVVGGLKTLLDSGQTNFKRDRQVDEGAINRAPAPGPRDVSAGYVRGIESNRDANDALIEQVNADQSLTPRDKATLIQALADLRANLGSNPVERAFNIAQKAEARLEDPTAADRHIMPYVARVMAQQPVQEDIVAEDRAVSGPSPVDVVAFHGSQNEFDRFDMSKAIDGAHYFTDSELAASNFGNVRKFRVRMDNPYVTDQVQLENMVTEQDEADGILPRDKIAGLVQQAKQMGHDGILIKGFADALETTADTYLPFDTSQISPVNDPMRISPRRPTAVGATEDAMGDVPLQIGADAILNSGLGEKLMPKVMKYLGIRGERGLGDSRTDDQILIDHFKKNLLHLYNSVTPEYRERARQWYVGANKLSQQAADKYRLTLAQVSGVMAALSPQKDWYMNYDLGIRTIDAYNQIQPTDIFTKQMASAFRRMIKKQNAGPQKSLKANLKIINGQEFQNLNQYEKAIFIRFWDEVNNPERGHRIITPEGELIDFQRTKKGDKSGTAWNGFGDIEKAISIIEDGSRANIDAKLGMMHKVRSFYNNILSPMSDQGDVTIDTHAVAAAHLRPFSGNHVEVMENFKMGGKSGITGAVGAYGLYAEAYRQAAAEVGILPREMQSITWEAIRGLFTPGFKGQKKNQETIANIWKKYDAGGINIDQARQEIFDAAGDIKRAAWEGPGPDNTAVEQNRSVANTGNLSGPSLSGTGDGRRVGEQPAGPLLRASRSVELDTDRLAEIIGQIDPNPPDTSSNVAEDLRKRLEMMREPGASSIHFDTANKTVKKAVVRLDPEERATTSAIKIGLDDSTRTSNEDLAVLTPLVADAFRTLAGNPNTSILGEFQAKYNRAEDRLFDRQIKVVNIGEQTLDGDMTPRMFYETFLHELGHAIESQSGFRSFVELMSKAFNADPDGTTPSAKLYRDIETISRNRRPELWTNADVKAFFLEQLTGESITGQLTKLGTMRSEDFGANTTRIFKAQQEAGKEPNVKAFYDAFSDLRGTLRYLFDPAELSADVIAAYLRNPKKFKKDYPEVAKGVRDVINQSKLAEYVTFHALAGLLGAGAMSQLLMAAMDDEDEPGALSLGRGALSAA